MPKHVARRLLLIAAAAVVAVAARYYFLDPSYYRYGNYRGDAPKIGDRTAWLPRMSQGLDLLVRSAIRGHEGMPARGGMADLTDSEVRAAVIHMFGQGAAPTPGSAAPAARPDPHFYKAIEGAEIYLGVVSAETLRAQHPGSDAESSMHRGIPSGKGYYHVNVSLFDTDTKAQIMDAQVRARVASPLMGSTQNLERMVTNGMVSYGNYFRMPVADSYTITVEIRRPGVVRPIEATFAYKQY